MLERVTAFAPHPLWTHEPLNEHYNYKKVEESGETALIACSLLTLLRP